MVRRKPRAGDKDPVQGCDGDFRSPVARRWGRGGEVGATSCFSGVCLGICCFLLQVLSCWDVTVGCTAAQIRAKRLGLECWRG